MEVAADVQEFALYSAAKQNLATGLYYKLVMLTEKAALGIVRQVGQNDGYEAYRRLAQRYAPRTLGRQMNRLTAIVNYDFGQEDGQLLDRLAAWERQVEEHERATTETVQDSMKCAIVQS
eukprot:3430709-Amphidinium_carterae.1